MQLHAILVKLKKFCETLNACAVGGKFSPNNILLIN